MTKSYKVLRAKLEARPDHAEKAAAAKAQLEAEDRAYFQRLGELRRARQMTQVALAGRLHLPQSSVSRLERQADLYVSTLRKYIEAAGGQLEVRAVFPDLDAEIRFEDFDTVDNDNPEAADAPVRKAHA